MFSIKNSLATALVVGASFMVLPAPPAMGSDVSDINPQIVGGRLASEPYPFMVSLQINGRHGCGGSLIAPQWVLTAAHCTSGVQTVRVGSLNRSSGGQTISVAQVINHPSYRGVSGGNDIALLRLSRPVTGITPIQLGTSRPGTNSNIRLLGWGQTRPQRGADGGSEQLKELDTRVLANSSCPGYRTGDLCIAGNTGQTACYGDSGGPALVGGGGQWTLHGATSRSGGSSTTCGVDNVLYTDVVHFRNWVQQHVGGVGNQPPVASFTASVNGLTVTLQDTSTDDQGVVSRNWAFGDGNSSTVENPIHHYAQSGTYTIRLTVADQQGLQSSASRTVTVSSGDGGGSCDGIAAWSATRSYQLGDRVLYNQKIYEAIWWSTGARPDVFSNTWREVGPCSGDNLPPVSNFSFAANGLTVQFTDRSTDQQGIISWQWNFGDGRTASVQNPVNSYSQAGSYTVSLTVANADGATHSSTQTVTVSSQDSGCGNLPAWSSSTVYVQGDQVRHNNVRYRANWWTQNNNPAQNSGPWEVWTSLGNCN